MISSPQQNLYDLSTPSCSDEIDFDNIVVRLLQLNLSESDHELLDLLEVV